jgi:hypothetical protein
MNGLKRGKDSVVHSFYGAKEAREAISPEVVALRGKAKYNVPESRCLVFRFFAYGLPFPKTTN